MKTRSTKLLLGLVVLNLFSIGLFAQSNIQKYTPSVLLQPGQMEFNLFNNLYTQTSIRDLNGDAIPLPERQSYLTNTFTFLYGISPESRINIGLEANITTAKYGLANTSIFDVLNNNNSSFRVTSLTSIGPKVKFSPLRSLSNLSVQSTFLIPVASNLETPRFVAHDRYSWINQFFYDKALSAKWRLFMEFALWYRFKANDVQESSFFRTPVSAILSYFPNSKLILFANTQYAPRFETLRNQEEQVFGQTQWYNLLGFGAKYQVSTKVGLELSYANFFLSRNDGAGQVINFGIRIIQ